MCSIGSFDFSEEEAYACEPFVTAKNGLGFVRNGKIKNIFALASRKRTKDDEADKVQEYIWNNFNMLPFALRWLLNEWDEKEAHSACYDAKQTALLFCEIINKCNEYLDVP